MDANKKQEVLRTLQQYLPIKRDIQTFSVAKAPEYLAKLLKDEEELKAFLTNPQRAFQNVGIDPKEIDRDLFTTLLLYLKNRQEGKRPGNDQPKDVLGGTATKKEKEEHQMWSFDHSKKEKEEYKWSYDKERGYKAKREKEEIVMRDKEFKAKGVGINPVALLNPELRMLFFPMQPLVTPELVEKIKEILEKE